MIFLGMLFALIGLTCISSGVVLRWVHKRLADMLGAFPRELHSLMATTDPQMKKATDFLRDAPRKGRMLLIGGGVLYLFGLGLMPPFLQVAGILVGVGFGVLLSKSQKWVMPFLQKRLGKAIQQRL